MKTIFKETEVGLIPEDWELNKIKELCDNQIQNGCFYEPIRKGKGTPFINVKNLFSERPIELSELELFQATQTELNKFEVRYGDILFTRSSLVPEGIAQCNIFLDKLMKSVTFDSHIIKIRVNSIKVNSLYLNFYCRSQTAKKYFRSNAKLTTMITIDQQMLGNTPIPLPPTLSEQEAIATVLSDTDTWIESLEAQIEKKKLIKQGTMQELLTGKRRLPGFGEGKGWKDSEVGRIPEDWEVKKLGDVGVFTKGQGVRKDESNSGDIPCIRYGEIYTKHNDYIKSFYSYISTAVAKTAKKIQSGDILFAGSGETKEDIGKCVAYVDSFEAYAGGDIVILSPYKCNSTFLGYLLNTPNSQKQKASRGQGDAVVHISSSQLSQIRISLPPTLAEQESIAMVLSEMDKEIEGLEKKLEKTKGIKQGLMQVLLTGKIRLV